jgi:hypothetical protein
VAAQTTIGVPREMIDMIRDFPVARDVEHCGQKVSVSALDIYAECPRCGEQLKVRSYSAVPEIEDVFDAVLEWMQQRGAKQVVHRRQALLDADSDECSPLNGSHHCLT